jgi:hypothetical protein
MTSCVYCFGCIVYWFFASGEIQPWAKENDTDKKQQDSKEKNNEITKF